MPCIVAVAAKATFIAVRLFESSRSVLRSPHCWSFHRVHPAARHDVCSSRQLVLAHFFEDFSCSPRNQAVSDELAPWTSLSCPCGLGRNFPPSSQGGDSCHELVEELRL